MFSKAEREAYAGGDVVLREKELQAPLSLRKPARIGVQFNGDLFHEKVPFEFITSVFDVMCSWQWPNAKARREGDETDLVDPGHTYQVLTKRLDRVPEWLDWMDEYWRGDSPFSIATAIDGKIPKHIHFGTSISTQKDADENTPKLLEIPAAVRYLSVEPMLEGLNLEKYLLSCKGCGNRGSVALFGTNPASGNTLCANACIKRGESPSLDGIIIGCESLAGGRAGRFQDGFIEAAIDLVRQCDDAGIPVFVKQIPINGRVSHDMSEWPREYPE
jgi:protein gp37